MGDWISSNGGAASSSTAANGGRDRIRLRSLHWDPFEPSTQLYMNMGNKPRMRNHYRGHKMALWLNLIPQIHLPGGTDVTLNHHTFQEDDPNLYVGKSLCEFYHH